MLELAAMYESEATTALAWMLKYNVLLLISAFMYATFAFGLYNLGAMHHRAVVEKNAPVGQFPPGYFVMLAASLLPLALTGFVLGDVYILSTRLTTLAVVLMVYGMVAKDTATFYGSWHRGWILFWISVTILLPMIVTDNPSLRWFVHDYEKWIAWIAVAVMFLFVWKGQWSTAKTLFKHYVEGNYSVKRVSLQFVRLVGFATQAWHYWLVPTKAPAFFGFDPIFVQGFIGAVGVVMVLLWSLLGYIHGRHARRTKKYQEQTLNIA